MARTVSGSRLSAALPATDTAYHTLPLFFTVFAFKSFRPAAFFQTPPGRIGSFPFRYAYAPGLMGKNIYAGDRLKAPREHATPLGRAFVPAGMAGGAGLGKVLIERTQHGLPDGF